MRLRADVVDETGRAKHAKGTIANGEPIITESLAPAQWVEIVEGADCCYLLRYSSTGECVGDTWHLTVNEAKAQAEFEYGITPAGWREMT